MIKNKNGFTLVEIIVVIVIIAILTAIAAPIYLKFIDEAKKSVAESNASTMYTQINLLLSINDSQDAMTKDIMKWIKQGGEIIYKGVKDNSVTKPVGYHDDAKRAIQKILGG
ncbi:MAG: prepilin-type N-terminal cleavage/methylation domain-containing protein, partial [Clostridiales bacterium]